MKETSVSPENTSYGLEEKWGKVTLDAGWTSVPNALLKYAGELKLDPTETLVLIYLMRFWWKVEDLPYPSISKTSEEMGVSRKTMTKKFASLQEKGFITKVKQGGRTKFSLGGLRKALAAEHRKQKEVQKTKQVDDLDVDDLF
jgi:DNA-binding MarR family transcriptional regulator